MIFRRVFFLLLSILIAGTPIASLAAGIPAIMGRTRDGLTIAADVESLPYRVEVWKATSKQKAKQVWSKVYEDEPCGFKQEYDSHDAAIYYFWCDKRAKSPLAGTKYVGRQVDGSCERGDPDVRYICVEGCDTNTRAPRIMTQDHWEC
jgi:hypothetical protein